MFDDSGTPALVYDAAPKNPLLGRWQVDSFESAPGTVVPVLPGTALSVVFSVGSVGGNAGCNDFTGTYGTNGNVVRIGPLATTRQACADDVMSQETAFLAALQGAAIVQPRAGFVNLTDISGSLKVALARPAAAEAASPSPSPTAAPTPTPKPTEKPTPTASSTPKPTEKPTAKPTEKPTAKPTEKPSAPPSAAPAVATCDLATDDGTKVATIAYPGTWSTVTSPADLACRYFDPSPITVPSDPSTLVTVVMASTSASTYSDAVAAATDPASWDVSNSSRSPSTGSPRRSWGDGDRGHRGDPGRDELVRVPRRRRVGGHGRRCGRPAPPATRSSRTPRRSSRSWPSSRSSRPRATRCPRRG